ncbi:hypothetical protein CRENBAI_013999 [Crenichthys baileyi]|uniref:Uncharacterized protein n=1 Tax=Crenichthys baileyi TaxID=28760 RepID=A0AAV9SCW5_9TELE
MVLSTGIWAKNHKLKALCVDVLVLCSSVSVHVLNNVSQIFCCVFFPCLPALSSCAELTVSLSGHAGCKMSVGKKGGYDKTEKLWGTFWFTWIKNTKALCNQN